MTRKSSPKKDRRRGARGAGPDRKSERPGTATPKVGKRAHGARETPRGKSERTPRVGAGPARRAAARGGAKPAALRQPVEAGGSDRGERGPVPGARPRDLHPDVMDSGAGGGRAFEIGERAESPEPPRFRVP